MARKRTDPGTALRATPRPETRPRPRPCHRCEAPTLRAITTSGLDVVVDQAPVTAAGEVAALLAGVPTYTWHRIPDHLVRRYDLVMAARPAGTPRQTVHPRHTCGRTWQALAPLAPRAADAPDDARPPY